MGLLSRLRAIDERISRPSEAQMKEAARWWWAFLLISAVSLVVNLFVFFVMSSDARFFLLVGPLIFAGTLAFLAGFQFNNHLRASGRTGGVWHQRVVR